jgi:hypothetical protein
MPGEKPVLAGIVVGLFWSERELTTGLTRVVPASRPGISSGASAPPGSAALAGPAAASVPEEGRLVPADCGLTRRS